MHRNKTDLETRKPNSYYTFLILVVVLSTITLSISGCVYLRLLEFRGQLANFDEYFSVDTKDDLALVFKKPVLYRNDFDYLSKLQPSEIEHLPQGKRSFYRFKKVGIQGRIIKPSVELLLTLKFNQDELLTHWTFSPMFLAMVPAEFLEASLRSLGSSTVNRFKRQVRADLGAIPKIHAQVPIQSDIVSVLGAPLKIIQRKDVERILYRFKLETEMVEQGYEERQFTRVKLDFDSKTHKLLKMSGRFAGMKLSIDYRKFQ